MSLDHNLISRANKLAHQYIHQVSNLLAMYQTGIELGTEETLQIAKDAETRLRKLIFEAQLSS